MTTPSPSPSPSPPPLAKTLRLLAATGRPAPLAGILLLSAAALFAGQDGLLAQTHADGLIHREHADGLIHKPHADGHPFAVEISTNATSPSYLHAVPFTMDPARYIDASTLETSDISTTSGTVRDLRTVLQHQQNVDIRNPDAQSYVYYSLVNMATDSSRGLLYVASENIAGPNDIVYIYNVSTLAYHGMLPRSFDRPGDVAVDVAGQAVYVADTGNNFVAVYNSTTLAYVADLTGTTFTYPRGLGMDASGGLLYVAGDNRVAVYNSTTRTHIADLTGTTFNVPRDVAVNSTGHIFVADSNNNRIAVHSPDRTYLTAITGQPAFVTVGGVAVDGSDNIYVSDTYGTSYAHPRIAIYNSSLDYMGDLPGSFRWQFGLYSDHATGELYVADTGNDRMQIFDTVHTFEVADPARGQVLDVSMPAGRVLDLAGNANEASNTARIEVARAVAPLFCPETHAQTVERGTGGDEGGPLCIKRPSILTP